MDSSARSNRWTHKNGIDFYASLNSLPSPPATPPRPCVRIPGFPMASPRLQLTDDEWPSTSTPRDPKNVTPIPKNATNTKSARPGRRAMIIKIIVGLYISRVAYNTIQYRLFGDFTPSPSSADEVSFHYPTYNPTIRPTPSNSRTRANTAARAMSTSITL